MKAVVLREFGGPEKLRFEEIATPIPAHNEVLIKVHTVTVNVTLDVLVRKGLYARKPSLPHILGTDPAGEVVALGQGVENLRIGQRVGVHAPMRGPMCIPGQESADPGPPSLVGIACWGGYAEYAAIRAENCFAIPANLDWPEASAIIRHLPTARHLLEKKAELRSGEWILVMGATGGLASCIVQVAKRLGANVIAAAGSDERVELAIKRFGADQGVNYRRQDLAAEVRRITGGRGADVVAENIGDPELWPGAMASLGLQGRLVTAGAHAGGRVMLDLHQLYRNRQRIIGSPTCDFSDVEWALNAAADGSIVSPLIDRIMPLHEAAEAHRLIEARTAIGKILLDPIASENASASS
jgi:NADPH2:quinone reductase